MTRLGSGDHVRGSKLPTRTVLVVAVLLLLRLAIPVLLVGTKLSFDLNGADVSRTWQIAHAPGVPYRDVPVEYAPVTTLIDRTLLATTPEGTEARLAMFNLVCDAAIVLALATWGARTVVVYLILSLPLVALAYFRTDLLSCAFLMVGLASIDRRRERAGGIAVALGYLAKLWPAVAIPSLIFERPRAGWWAAAASLAGTLGWFAFAPAGPWQVLSLRGAVGWQIESTVGAVLLLFGATPRTEAGAVRVGGSLPLVRPGLAVLILVAALIVWRFRRDVFATTLAGLSALLFLSPLLSPQFVMWLLPLAAVLAVRDELDVAWPMVAVLLTVLVLAMQLEGFRLSNPTALAVAILVRNATLPFIAWSALSGTGGSSLPARWIRRPVPDRDRTRPA